MKQNTRIEWADAGKCIAMVFVYYGHTCIQFSDHFPSLMIHGRFLTPMIIPFFFFLSGFILKDQFPIFKIFFLKKFSTLVIPLYFFNIFSLFLLLLMRLFHQGDLVLQFPGSILFKTASLFIAGAPVFNGVCWFLTCLFTVEIIYFFIAPVMKNYRRLMVSILLFSIAGYLMVPFLKNPALPINVAKFVGFFWYVPTALTAIVFFQIGILLRRTSIMEKFDTNRKIWFGFLLSAIFHLLAFNLNYMIFETCHSGQYIDRLRFGNYFLFYLASFSGISLAIFLSMLLKSNKIIKIYGKNTLALLGLNGIFVHFIFKWSSNNIIEHYTGSELLFILVLIPCMTFVELALCFPFFGIINRCLAVLIQTFSRIFTAK